MFVKLPPRSAREGFSVGHLQLHCPPRPVASVNCQELGCLEVPTLLISACWYLLPPTSESSAASMKAGNSESRPREYHGTRTVRSIPQTDIHSDHSKSTINFLNATY